MATLRTAIQITDGMSPAFRSMNNAMNIVINSFETLQTASHNAVDTHSIQAARGELARAEVAINQVERDIEQANNQQQRFNRSVSAGRVEATGLSQNIMGYVKAFVGMLALKKGADMTDTYANQNSRLAMINDGTQTQLELQNKIFQAAQRSRGVYGETVNTVAKLGLLARDAFKGNDETIKFAELMNKSFRVSGSSITEASSGMYQLTQALAAGKLQGDEFRSVMENAPMVAQAIAKFTGKSMGELKQMSADGTISADIIKNAMFAAADEINAKFETMPKTFGTVWTSMANTAVMQFSTTMQKINDYLNSTNGTVMINGISSAISALVVIVGTLLTTAMVLTTFFSGNWDILTPIIWGLVAAFVAYNAAAMVTNGILAYQKFQAFAAASALVAQSGATFMATVAQEGFNMALYACPITWIIMAIIGLIVIFYAAVAAVNHFAGTSLSATGIIAGAFMVALAFIGNLFVGFFNLVIDVVSVIWNRWAGFAEFIANVLDGPISFIIGMFITLYLFIVNVVTNVWNHIVTFANFLGDVFRGPINSTIQMFVSMGKTIFDILFDVASAIDKVFGSRIRDALDGLKNGIQRMTTDLFGEAKIKIPRMDSTSMHINRFEYGNAFNAGNNFGKNIESKLDISKLDVSKLFGGTTSPADQLKYSGETAANTGAMKDSMKASEEDMKYLRDIAEQEVINRFTTAEIKVDMPVSAVINNEMDLDGVVAHLEQKVYDTMNAAAEGVHS